MLTIYSHNASFDTAGYIPVTDPHLTFFSHQPFIWGYKLNEKECKELGIKSYGKGREIIKFLDTMSIWRMPLSEIGEKLGYKKSETPEYLIEGREPTKEEYEETLLYLDRDCLIPYKGIEYVKQLLKKDDINIKRYYTINQIAIQYLLKKLSENKEADQLWWDKNTKKILRTQYRHSIHEAYRGGRVEAWQTGEFKNIRS